ncbi:ABC transporter permease [Stappia sp. F7233]|uniref:ABC transporter permease n=1 Tax=Stappia albiluteola TaxID=2758565 RepID=A0A839AFQ9_9HYPH|nr:ABC transporter permease [Stappia albiluteola]MBA5777722.1 ABC transporter permease [Stappia albiluteola]
MPADLGVAARIAPTLDAHGEGNILRLCPGGCWTIHDAEQLESLIAGLRCGEPVYAVVDLSRIDSLDTAGAWLLHRLQGDLEYRGARVDRVGVSDTYAALFSEIEAHHPTPWKPYRSRFSVVSLLEKTGRQMTEVANDAVAVCHIVGSLAAVLSGILFNPRRLRAVSVAVQFDRSCIGAVPIVLLMSFLIGGIIAQQGGFYLRQFGADLFAVDLAGVLVLREIGVLLTAIMVAGRSGSAFTAELGSMKMREEIDALHVIGLKVTEVLILPRILALMLALPVLAFLADLAALFGAGLVTWLYLDIVPQTFLQRLQEAVTMETVNVGLIKAPFMALIIGLVACVEGLKVGGSSESLGRHTTLSVVKAIFMVIVVDGLFAIFFASVGI